ncbi:MAG: tryptophan 7-halogenase [Gammaproteobacteria bacterium]|nr:tryptophan 7-halogenase [Gammaproteobacteria bacterium]MCW5583715.1 tryptophan 7-halogenase [Gammaproteobacteria bacterium]
MDTTTKNSVPITTKILIVGGGPAGSMSAIILAREGLEVTLLEKEKFPRYHIGESLLNFKTLLEFVGISEKIRQYGFVKKNDGFFRIKHGTPPGHISFLSGDVNDSYQVVRSEFDKLLLDYAQEQGANVIEEIVVTKIKFKNGIPKSAEWKNKQGNVNDISFDYIIDATGLSGIIANTILNNRQFQNTFANVAIGSYWDNYKEYKDDDGVMYKGAFSMEALIDGSGWVWAIPLHNKKLSVGAVIHKNIYFKWLKEKGNKESVYNYALSLCRDIPKLIDESKKVDEVRIWQDYSYVANKFGGPYYRLVGDAAGFIDPLFSSGVHLALFGSLSAAATICASIKGEVKEEEASTFHDICVRSAYTRFVVAVASIYRQIQNQDKFVLPRIKKDDFQYAFDLITPVLTGSVDTQSTNIKDEELSKTLNYFRDASLELHRINTGNPVSKLVAKNTYNVKDSSVALSSSYPINGHYIRLHRGKLGLQSVTYIERIKNAIIKKINKAIIKILKKIK